MGNRLRTRVPGLQHPWPPWDLSPLTPLCPPTLIGPRAPRDEQGLRSGFLDTLVTSRTSVTWPSKVRRWMGERLTAWRVISAFPV